MPARRNDGHADRAGVENRQRRRRSAQSRWHDQRRGDADRERDGRVPAREAVAIAAMRASRSGRSSNQCLRTSVVQTAPMITAAATSDSATRWRSAAWAISTTSANTREATLIVVSR